MSFFSSSLRLMTALALFCYSVQAQSVVSVAGSQQTAVGGGERTVTLSLRGVTLKEALTEVSRQSGVVVRMSDDVLTSKIRVSVILSGTNAREAVATVLKGTGFEVESSAVGGMLVMRSVGRGRQSPGVITGKITDAKSGRGISGVNISLDQDTRGVLSDESGTYRISGVSLGQHTVSVRLVGYAKQTRSVTVGDGTAVTADFRLEPSANVLNDVVVTGTMISTELKAVPNAITVITAKQIEERGITRIDQLFRGEIPGLFSLERGTDALLDEVTMYSRGATRISGANTNTIKTYVDGVEMADSRYLSQIDPKSIERIEILTGPQASTIYGSNAINGVMQIFTKRGSTVRPNININLSEGFTQNNFSSGLASSHQYNGDISGTEGRMSYNLGSGWDYTGAWTPGKQTQRVSLYGSGRYQIKVASIDISTRRGWTQSKVLGEAFQTQTALREEGLYAIETGFGVIANPNKQLLYGRTFGLSLNYNPVLWWSHQVILGSDASDTEQLGLAPSFKLRVDTTFSSSQNTINRVSQSYSSTLRVPILASVQTLITFGGDRWRSSSSIMNWTATPPATISSPSVTPNAPSKNSGAYVQGQFGFWDALFFTYGVRTDWNPTFGEKAKVRPGRYGISYATDIGIVSAKLRGSYGRSIRPPASGLILNVLGTSVNNKAIYGDPYVSRLANPELGPEFQQGGEGGVELYFGSKGSVAITRYNQTVDGLISSVPGADSLRALQPGIGPNALCSEVNLRSDGYCYLLQSKNLNVGSIRNQGWELHSTINTGPFTTSGTYSWNKSRVIGITSKYRALLTSIAFAPGQTFDFAPEHTWSTNISYAHYGTSVMLNVNGVGEILRTGLSSELGLLTSDNVRLLAGQSYRLGLPTSYRTANAGYTTANLNASQKLSQIFEATLNVTNLTNAYQNDVEVKNPTIGRQTHLGLRLRL